MSCKEFARFETNPIFRCFAGRYGVAISVALQAVIEAWLGLAAGYVMNQRLEANSIGIVASVFALGHIMAWRSNKKFLAKNNL